MPKDIEYGIWCSTAAMLVFGSVNMPVVKKTLSKKYESEER